MSNLRNSYANVRQTFCEKNFAMPGRESRWYDLTCLVQMGKGRVAKIELSDLGHSGHYSGFVVKILHETNGPIDCKTFRFVDYLDDREDTRKDHPDEHPYVWAERNSFEWYIAVPTQGARMHLMAIIATYIEAFK